MNNMFELKRLLAHARRNYTRNAKSYIWLLVFILCAAIFTILVSTKMMPADIIQANIFLIICGFLTHRSVMISMNSMENRSLHMDSDTRQASTLERYIFVWFNSLVAFYIVCILVFVATCAFNSAIIGAGVPISTPQIHIIIYALLTIHAINIFSHSATLHHTMFVSFITILAIIAIILIGALFTKIGDNTIAGINFPQNMRITQYVDYGDSRVAYVVSALSNREYAVIEYLRYSLPIILWITAYFKFKERELK